MDCPVCKNAMITLELDIVEIDHCLNCAGIWLDAGELEVLLGDPFKAQTALESFQLTRKTKEKPHKCPICDKRMQKVFAGSDPVAPMIDRCPRKHGIWFDRGELQHIIDHCLGKDSRIGRLLADMFAGDHRADE